MSRNQSSSRQHACQTHYEQISSVSSSHLELLPDIGYGSERLELEVVTGYPQDGGWYRMLYEQIPAIYLTLGISGRILSVNQFGAQVLGFAPEELLQKNVSQIFAPDELVSVTDVLFQLGANSTTDSVCREFQLNCPDSNIGWVRATLRKLPMVEREPIILMVCEDITDQKRSEDALRESEQRFHTIAEIAPVMLWTAGVDGFFNFFNQYWLQFTGSTIEQVKGYGWLNTVHPEERLHYLQTYQAAFSAREPFVLEYRLLHYDGEYRWILDTGIPRFTPTGLFSGYIGCAMDITERKAAEVALSQTQSAAQAQIDEMERLSRLKDEFLSTVSHELRTPLTNMKMAISMLGIALQLEAGTDHTSLANCLPETLLNQDRAKAKRYFHILNNECDREINLINNFLDLQKLDSNVKSLILETIDIPTWLNRLVQVFQTRHHRFNQPLYLQIAADLPKLNCDPFSLERVLIELLTNACKFSPSTGQVYLNVNIVNGDDFNIHELNTKGLNTKGLNPNQTNQVLQFTITNTGTEIPVSEIPRIFDKFYRIPSNDPWKQGGTGLGLALVKKLTKHMGGQISVVSRSNQTSFTVSFPLA